MHGISCREYEADRFGVARRVIVGPDEMKESFLHQNHDSPSAGHQGWRKTLERLKKVVYWIGMADDTRDYCRYCDNCMKAKQALPPRAPLISSPIGKAWERIAINVKEVPINSKGNKYLLVQRCPTGGPQPCFVRPALRPKCLYPYPSRVHTPVLRPATKWNEVVVARSKYSWTALF